MILESIVLTLFLIAVVVVLVEIRKSKRQTLEVVEQQIEPEGQAEVAVPRLRHALLVGHSPSLATVAFVLKMVEHYDRVDTVDGHEAIARLTGLTGPSVDVVAVVDPGPENQHAVEFVRTARSEPVFDTVRIVVLVPESQTEKLSDALASVAAHVEFLPEPFSTETLREKLGTVAS